MTTCRRLASQPARQSVSQSVKPSREFRTVRGGTPGMRCGAGVLDPGVFRHTVGRYRTCSTLPGAASPRPRQVTRGMGMMSMGSKETAVWTATGRRTGLSDVCCVDMDVDIAVRGSNKALAQADNPLRQAASLSPSYDAVCHYVGVRLHRPGRWQSYHSTDSFTCAYAYSTS